jgi:hypothetical protein
MGLPLVMQGVSNGIPKVTVRRVLRKRLYAYLKAYKLSIFRNTRHSNIWIATYKQDMFCCGLKGIFWTLEYSSYLLAGVRVCYQRGKAFSLQATAEHSCLASQTRVTTYHIKQTLLTQPILTCTVLPST